VIDPNLIASYCNANYQIANGAEPIILRIDQYSEPLAQFLAASRQPCAAIISAYNPRSQLLSNEVNRAAHESLRNFLKHQAHPVIESVNTDPTGKWPVEKSFLITGLSLNAARSLGQQLHQNAIVWIGNDAIPRLILLR
jgi:hypothetical protein